MTMKIYDVTLRFALDKPDSMEEPEGWHWDYILRRVAGEGLVVMRASQEVLTLDRWVAEKGPSLVLAEGAREHLGRVWEFAESIDRLPRLVRALDHAVFPTFFGKPSQTVLMSEQPHNFYFEIYPRGTPWPPHGARKFLMNGGVIYHPTYKPDGDEPGDWSVHT